jgi:hypothetical protein
MRPTSDLPSRLFVAIAVFASWGCSESEDSPSKPSAATSADASMDEAGAVRAAANSSDGGSPGKTPYTLVYDDPLFKERFVDVDEWRDEPVRHRYVHGGFTGTDARFSIYFPPEDKYEGRFFHYILPVPGNENAVANPEYPDASYTVGFAVDSGAYLVETNMGALGFSPTADPEISLWRASAAAAEHSRLLANEYYPEFGPHRPFGYAWGGSGGAFKTIACIESTDGVWDGVVPFIHASPIAMPNNFTVQAYAMRLLRDKVPGIVDAVDPGGSGDMYAGLNDEQRKALEEVTKFGFPPDAWFNYKSIAFGYTGVLASLLPAVLALDGSYFDDFWTKPGHLGVDAAASLAAYRIDAETTIAEAITAEEVKAMGLPLSLSAAQPSNAKLPGAFRLATLPPGDLQGASITFTSGAATGVEVQVAGVFDDLLVVGYGQNAGNLGGIQPGDTIHIDNSVYLAIQTYHRHTLPGPEYHVYDQYRDADGEPLYPQRSIQTSSLFNQSGMMSGKFKGKMIVVENLMDEIAFPWHADWYRSKVQASLGAQFEDQYRLWYVEKAMHTPSRSMTNGLKPAIATRIINFGAVLQQALRDVAAWTEKDIAPPASTPYEVVDGQVHVPPTAADRKGVQPVVIATANGGERAEVKIGEAVKFSAVIEVPPDTGTIVGVEWDFEGDGDFPTAQQLADTQSDRLEIETSYAFSKPGTYFPAVRASAHRDSNADTPYARITNLGRVRVVVK